VGVEQANKAVAAKRKVSHHCCILLCDSAGDVLERKARMLLWRKGYLGGMGNTVQDGLWNFQYQRK